MIAKKRQFENPLINKIVVLFLVLVVLGGLSWSITKRDDEIHGTIYPNVYVDGVSFSGKTKKDIIDYFAQKNQALKSVAITAMFQNSGVATFSAEKLNLKYDSETSAERAFLIGRSSHLTSRIYQRVASLLKWEKFNFDSRIEYDTSPVKDFIANSEDAYNKPAKNALFNFEGGRVVSFRKEESGLQIESDKFLSAFNQTIEDLKKKVENKNVELGYQILEPEITLTKANSFGIEELLAVGKSNFSHSIPERIHNIILASSRFNGVLVAPGKVFSFNGAVGDISKQTGFLPAYIIKEGRTVLGDGGGVCQVSTTLFRAALNAGLPIIERVAHAYRVGYYENDSGPGFDATVFDPIADLKIKNDTGAYILIQTEVDKNNNLLYFKLYGKKDNRNIEIGKAILTDQAPPPADLYQDDPTLKKGLIKQVDFSAWGGKASFDYKVTLNGAVTFQQTFASAYKPWQAVYLRGTAD